ncbi:MAG: peptidoglycan DD-metalloendopeptidase family protein [Deltaproteobacteria bacterium]|nr:peptidoglycan DD-metalloendopeptidase family protein [Deltaproteobacteria bacterium]
MREAARISCFFAATAALIILWPATPSAQPLKRERIKKEKRLEDVQRRISEEKKGIKVISEKEARLLTELETASKNLSAKRAVLRKAEARTEALKRMIDGVSSSLSAVDRRLSDTRGLLSKRVRAMSKMQRAGAVNAAFSLAPGHQTSRLERYLSAVMGYDRRLIEESGRSIKELKSEKARLSSMHKEMGVLTASVSAAKEEAEALKRTRLTALSRIKNEKDARMKLLGELEEASRELTEFLKTLKTEDQGPLDTTGFASMKGRLDMPVDGRVVSNYGKVKHPRFNTVTFNNGVVIEAKAGEPVRNIYDGKVAYTGWLKGYGLVMILDHGSGFYTLFAYLQETLKEKGDLVKKGEPVAAVGDTGPEGATGLYFELRERGVPRDPVPWFASR